MDNEINIQDCFSGIYKGRKVLITGHTGFKGSWLTLWLLEFGAKVAGISNQLPKSPSFFKALELEKRMENFEGDICDLGFIKDVFEKFKPEIVFHLAAQPIVRKSYDDPKLTFDINVGGTVNVLECIRGSKSVRSAVVVTSDKCYENTGKKEGYVETDPLGGSDPYSASKACVEIVTASFYRSFFRNEGTPNIASARAGNVIGGGDWAQDRIIPDCIRAWLKGEDVILRKPNATRPWQHVLESLSGYLLLASRIFTSNALNGEAFNFGPNSTGIGSVGDLTEIFLRDMGKISWEHIPLEKEKAEANLLTLNCSKALSKLSWIPVMNFEETVQITAQWYKEYYKDPDHIIQFSLNQIKEYVEKASQNKVGWPC